LSNVIISEKAEDVLYGSIDILLAQLHCYNSLRNFTLIAWKYAINLCGTELPLYTNRQMVQALQEMQAFSVIPHGQSQSEVESWVANQFIFKITRGANRAKLNLKEQLGISPITPMYKASVYMALTKRFVEFILDDMEVNTFRNFLVNAMSPEEFFYATINQMTRAPDNYASAKAKNITLKLPFVSSSYWGHQTTYCVDKKQNHDICIISVADMLSLNTIDNVFFFNKYWITYDHVVMDCAEERLVRRNQQEYDRDCE
jgi:hypothetical protein